VVPGVSPVEVLAKYPAYVKPEARAAASDGPEPMEEYDDMKGASAYTAATVVISLMARKVEAVSEPQGPMEAISAI